MNLSEKLSAATIYKFFSECFYFPDENQIATVKSYQGKIPGSYEMIIEELNNPQQLQIDYSRLFIGPFEVLSPPYGSVYIEESKKTFGDSTVDIIQLYQNENLNIELKEPPDHIAVELEFMHYLISKDCEAIYNGNNELSASYIKKQKQFIKMHLSLWVEEFSELIIQNSKSKFYKLLASKLRLKVKSDLINYYLN